MTLKLFGRGLIIKVDSSTDYYHYGSFAGKYSNFFRNKDRCGVGGLNSNATIVAFFGLECPHILVFGGVYC